MMLLEASEGLSSPLTRRLFESDRSTGVEEENELLIIGGDWKRLVRIDGEIQLRRFRASHPPAAVDQRPVPISLLQCRFILSRVRMNVR